MPTLAIIGAGPGLGAATARRFGRAGFTVALVARDRAHLDALAADLERDGVTARGYVADVRDPAHLQHALDEAARDLGPVDVLTYSPLPHRDFLRPVLESTPDDLAAAVEFSVLGPVAAVQQVLPGMRSVGGGSILFINGASAVRPNPDYAGTSIAFAGESAYGRMLHDVLAPAGIHVGQLIIPRGIGGGEPTHEPDVLADTLWQMHHQRGDFRRYAAPLDL